MNWLLKYLLKIKIPIKTKFKIMGAAEATANLLWELSIAAKKEDKLTNSKKGKVILVKSIASFIFSVSATNPGAIKPTKASIKISITKTKINNPENKRLKISLANLLA